jgi:hypothetical protein
MAKYKAARGNKDRSKSSPRSAVPCLVLIVSVMALVILLFYLVLQSGQ